MTSIEHSQAVAAIQEGVRAVRRTVGELENLMMYSGPGSEKMADLELRLTHSLRSLGRQMPIVLEIVGLPQARLDFLAAWKEFDNNIGKTKVLTTPDDAFLISEPLEALEEIVALLRNDSDETALSRGQLAQLETLEYVLRSAPQILLARNIVPTRELDIHRVLESHLECTFPDYTKRVALPKGLKAFEPDGAIPSLEALLEFKFIDSKAAAPKALSGIMEDVSGYGGSKDWTRFYSLIYQSGPFLNEARFGRSLRLSGYAAQWRTIVVTGASGATET